MNSYCYTGAMGDFMKIYNLGSLNIDYVYAVEHFVKAGETLSSDNMQIFPGGKGLNQSVALAKAGAKVIHGGLVGNNGEFLIDTLSAAGVDVSRIKTVNASCGHAIIQVDANAQNCILLYAGTNHFLDKAYIEQFLSDAEKDDILLLQNETNCIDTALNIASAKKMQVAFNPSPFNSCIKDLPLKNVKWWFCNEIEAAALFGGNTEEEITNNFLKHYKDSNLILTLGSRGCIFKNALTTLSQPIFKVNAVDTTAAGDTFTGYFLAAVTSGKDIAFALKFASKASAIAVSRKGASKSIPTLDEVNI